MANLVGTIILTDYDFEMLKERRTIYATFEPIPGYEDNGDEIEIEYMTEEEMNEQDDNG